MHKDCSFETAAKLERSLPTCPVPEEEKRLIVL